MKKKDEDASGAEYEGLVTEYETCQRRLIKAMHDRRPPDTRLRDHAYALACEIDRLRGNAPALRPDDKPMRERT
jgi:hypothetical protein